MTIRGVTWSPSTCGCVIELEYDDTTPLDTRPYTIHNIAVCSIHTGLGDLLTIYNTIRDENSKVSLSLDEILKRVPTSLLDQLYVLQNDGITRVLKKGIRFQFTITGTAPNRVLNISFINYTLTTQQRTNAQTWLNNRFGVGKVILS